MKYKCMLEEVLETPRKLISSDFMLLGANLESWQVFSIPGFHGS